MNVYFIKTTLVTVVFILPFLLPPSPHSAELTLAESIEIAKKNNPITIISEEGVNIANFELGEARSKFYPEFDIKHGYLRSSEETHETKLMTRQVYDITGGVMIPGRRIERDEQTSAFEFGSEWVLYSGGYNTAKLRFQKANLEVKKHEASKNSQKLVYDVTEAYYRVLKAQRMVKVAETALRYAENNLKTIETKFQQQEVIKLNLLDAKVQVATQQKNLKEAVESLELAKALFNKELGRNLKTEVKLVDDLDRIDGAHITWQTGAFAEHPDYKMVEKEVTMAEEGVKMAKADYYRPHIKFKGRYEYRDDHYLPQDPSWDVGVYAEWKIFNGFKSSNQLNRTMALLRQAKAKKALIESSLDVQVKNDIRELEATIHQVKVARSDQEKASEQLRITELAYKEKLATDNDLYAAQVAKTKADADHFSAMYDYQVTRAKLKRDMGKE